MLLTLPLPAAYPRSWAQARTKFCTPMGRLWSWVLTLRFSSNANVEEPPDTRLKCQLFSYQYFNSLRCWLILQNPSAAVTYSGHVQNATVARISPSGYYCASADASGTGKSSPLCEWADPSQSTGYVTKVRVWDTVGEDQILKGEYKVISGKMCVLSASPYRISAHSVCSD